MSKKTEDDVFTMEKVAKTWTSPRLYEIHRNGKVVLKLKDEDDAKQVLEYLNKNKCKKSGKKGSNAEDNRNDKMVECRGCGELFVPTHHSQKYCSDCRMKR